MKPKVWKMLGVAGLAGVAATGVIIARDERRRSQMTPDEVRERLHERLGTVADPAPVGGSGSPPRPPGRRRRSGAPSWVSPRITAWLKRRPGT